MNRNRRLLFTCGVVVTTWILAVLIVNSSLPPDLALTLSLCLAAFGLLGAATVFGRRPSHGALIRLDHFLPFARRKRQLKDSESLWTHWARQVFPKGLFFNRNSGEAGLIRRLLRRFGPSAEASPSRRVIQTVCFIVFISLFYYVCWPYSAQPSIEKAPVAQLQFQTIDPNSGFLVFIRPADLGETLSGTEIWHLELDPTSNSLPLQLERHQQDSSSLTFSPIKTVSDSELDQLLFATAPLSLFDHPRPYWPDHYTTNLASKERIPAELFLILDPLVSLSTALASKNWVWSLSAAATILVICLIIPRGFCGYLCPLGTLIDIFDHVAGKRLHRFRSAETGWWVHIKYYLLAAVLLTSAGGVLTSGYVSAIPVLTRGLLFAGEPFIIGLARGWHLVPPIQTAQLFSIVLFLGVLSLGFLRPRFWCKYVCPTGAVFSLGNLFRATDRKVEDSCIHCHKCVNVCPFDAIKQDYTTRGPDCTQCQTCAGVCPTHSIKFVERWNVISLKPIGIPRTGESLMGRRGFLSWTFGSAAAVATATTYASLSKVTGARLNDPAAFLPIRPPGSVPEREFLQQCIRCGECFKACPNNVLQPLGFEQGLEGLWTPRVQPDWAGCESSCNACGQVCPTGAIRPLPLEEKRAARIGLAIVDQTTCLPFAEREACQLCVDECRAAGYDAIEFTYAGTEADASGRPVPGTGYLAPVVIADKCVGCGLCQTRCRSINVDEKQLLSESAIVIHAGTGREDRLLSGSYIKPKALPVAKQTASPPLPGAPAPTNEPRDPFADLP